MKIGIDARMYSSKFTGIGRYTHELIKNLLQIDTKNTYVVFLNQQEYNTFPFSSPQVEKVLVNAPHYSLQEQTTFVDILLKKHLDLVHFTHFNAPLFYRKPFIVTIHDLTLSFYKGKKRTSLLERTAYNLVIKNVVRNARHIIAVSNNTKHDIQKLFSTPQEKISVIYEAVSDIFQKITDKNRLKKTKEKFNLQKPFLLYTGVWRDHKNITGLLRAFALLLKEEKKEIYLVITGKEDPYYPEVKELPQQLGIEKNVIYTGFVKEEELVDIYNLATLFVFPSLYEGFGLPLLESMSCGTPVIASNKSSIPEIGGDACLYFDPENIRDMKEKIKTALDESSVQESLVKKGYKRIQKFSWKQMAEKTLEVYKKNT